MGAPRMLWLFNYNDQVCERGRKGLSRGEFLPDGMEPPKPEAMPRRKRRVILVIAVSAIVVAAGFLVWEVFVRPRSLAEVYGFDHWSPGSTVTVVGTITSIERQNTSYGPAVYLGLDGGPGCAGVPSVASDPTAKYAIGARFQTTLHFQRYTINGDPAVSAPELQCPFPSGLRAIGTVLDAGSLYAGRLFLVYNGTESNGTVHYEIVTANGAAYPPDTLPATLRKSTPLQGSDPILPAGAPIDSFARWIDFGGLQYLGALGAYSEFPIVDEMSSLAAGIWTRPCDFGRPLLRAGRRLIWERDPLQPANQPEQRSLALPHGRERKRPARFRRYVPCRRRIEPDLSDLESGPGQYERRRHLLGRRLRRADRAGSDAHLHHTGNEPVARDREPFVLESRARPEPDPACVTPRERNRDVDERLPRERDPRDVRERHPRAHRLGWRRKSF